MCFEAVTHCCSFSIIPRTYSSFFLSYKGHPNPRQKTLRLRLRSLALIANTPCGVALTPSGRSFFHKNKQYIRPDLSHPCTACNMKGNLVCKRSTNRKYAPRAFYCHELRPLCPKQFEALQAAVLPKF